MLETFHYLNIGGEILVGFHQESDLMKNVCVLGFWKVNTFDNVSLYEMIIESLGMVDIDNISTTLSYINDMDVVLDGQHLLVYMLESHPTYIARKGVDRFIRYILCIDPNEYWNWIKNQGETPDFTTMPFNKEIVWEEKVDW